jgi:hypothetical protein
MDTGPIKPGSGFGRPAGPHEEGTIMNSRHLTHFGIAAIIGAAVLAITPATSSATSPQSWNVCPATDTEPVCDLATRAASNGAGSRPATAPHDDEAADTERIDIPDYNCDEWRNLVIAVTACPG